MADSDESAWRLRLLDSFALSGPAGDAGLTASKAVALLVFLALQRDRAARRDKIANLLWENVDTAQGRVNLRQALSAIRRAEAGGPPIVEADTDTLKLAAAVRSDVDRFDALAAGGVDERREAAALYHSDLVAGFSVRDAPAFNEWLAIAQAQWRQRAVGLLMSLADEALRPGGDLNAGAAAALKLLAIDPFNEAGHRALMRIYARQGRAALALAQYRSLADLLRRELQVAPDAETQALYEEVRGGRRQAGSASPPPAAALPPNLLAPPAPEPSDPLAAVPLPAAPASPARRRPRAGVIALLLSVVAIAAAGLWLTLGARTAQAPRIARIFPIAASDEQEFLPALSPDGTMVVYGMARSENADLYLASVLGQADPVRLTDHPADDGRAAWRPDGRAIAFVRSAPNRDAPCSVLLRAMPVGEERVLGACRGSPTSSLAWAADGSALYMRDEAGGVVSRIFRLPLGGGPATPVTELVDRTFPHFAPAVSNDGRRLAFIRRTAAQTGQLIVRDLSTDAATALEPQIPYLHAVAWSRGDTGLIYSVSQGSEMGLWWRAVDDDGRPVRLSSGLLNYSDLSFSSALNRLAVQVSQDRTSITRLPARAMTTGAAQPVPGLRSGLADREPAQSRDGRIVLVSGRSGADQLWLMMPGRALQPLTDAADLAFADPVWSPNGRVIAAVGTRKGRSNIYLVDAGNGRIVRVTNSAGVNLYPAWSTDGRYLYWTALGDGKGSVRRVEPGRPRRPAEQIAEGDIAVMRTGLGSDRAFYYTRWGEPGLFRRAIGGDGRMTGPETTVVADLQSSYVESWAMTAQAIVYPRFDTATGRVHLHRYDLASRTDARIAGSAALRGDDVRLSAAPDGSVLVTRTVVQSDISGIDFE